MEWEGDSAIKDYISPPKIEGHRNCLNVPSDNSASRSIFTKIDRVARKSSGNRDNWQYRFSSGKVLRYL